MARALAYLHDAVTTCVWSGGVGGRAPGREGLGWLPPPAALPPPTPSFSFPLAPPKPRTRRSGCRLLLSDGAGEAGPPMLYVLQRWVPAIAAVQRAWLVGGGERVGGAPPPSPL